MAAALSAFHKESGIKKERPAGSVNRCRPGCHESIGL